MFTWPQIALVLLRIVLRITNWLHDEGKIDEGYRKALSDMSLLVAARVTERNKLVEWANGLSEPEVDKELLDLVRARTGGTKSV